MSHGRPFANVAYLNERKREVVAHLPVDQVVDFTVVADGRSVELPGFLDVEAGHQGSTAAVDNAYDCIVAFLRTTGVLPGDPPAPDPGFYEVTEPMYKEPGRTYRFRGANFERVAPGSGSPTSTTTRWWPTRSSGPSSCPTTGTTCCSATVPPTAAPCRRSRRRVTGTRTPNPSPTTSRRRASGSPAAPGRPCTSPRRVS
ncbi:hypothetical protein ACFQL0_13190 [Haloplanus litoreus]|uniref:hypothetical protein n=1 Tax=Haloplanus litoreus TaxID=767515 RepID=UPI00360EA63C